MHSAMKLLLSAMPITIRPILEIHDFVRRTKLLAPSRVHSVPMHSQFLRRTAIYSGNKKIQLPKGIRFRQMLF